MRGTEVLKLPQLMELFMGLSVKTRFELLEATISARKKSNDGWALLLHKVERRTKSPTCLIFKRTQKDEV